VEWLKPYTDDMIVYLAKEKGVKSLVLVPISFVSDHIETLEEMDVEYKELAEANGIVSCERAPALNTNPVFIEALADMVEASWQDAKRVGLASDIYNADPNKLRVQNPAFRRRNPGLLVDLLQDDATEQALPLPVSLPESAYVGPIGEKPSTTLRMEDNVLPPPSECRKLDQFLATGSERRTGGDHLKDLDKTLDPPGGEGGW
jgi:Ferrochelatase